MLNSLYSQTPPKLRCTTKISDFLIKGIDTIPKRGVADNYYLWDNGSVIKVKFMKGGSNFFREKVVEYAKIWEQYANIQLQFVADTSRKANIRIKLGKGMGHNSYIGTFNNLIPNNQPTLNLDTTDLIDIKWMKSVVLHEFGHALGLLHEQSYPEAIHWNKDTVYKYYDKWMGWSNETVDYQVFRVNDQFYTNGTEYDPKSIMHYSIDPWQTLDSFSVSPNYELSNGDKRLIAALYPKDKIRSELEVPKVTITNLTSINVINNTIKKGLSIYPSFDLQSNSKIGQVFLVARLTDELGNYILDNNTRYNWGGYVAAYVKINVLPASKVSYNKGKRNMELFIPYTEIPLRNGTKVKVEFSVFLDDTKNFALCYLG